MARPIRVYVLLVCATTVVCWAMAQQTPGEAATLQPAETQGLQESSATPESRVSAREATFQKATEAFKKANEGKAELLSPKYYAEARKSLQQAQEIYDRGGKLADVRSSLSRCMENLELAAKTVKLCQIALKDVLAVREEVLATGLSFDRSSDFREAEKKLRQAAEKMEKGDLKGTERLGAQATERYRKAVLQVLGKQIIPDARRKLKAAKAGYTNEAYKRAEESLKDLERHLKRQNKASYSITELTSHVNEGIKGALRTPGSGL